MTTPQAQDEWVGLIPKLVQEWLVQPEKAPWP